MRLSLGVTTSMPVKEGIALARIAEEKGYHRVWVGEDLGRREAFSYVSVLASKTSTIGLGTGIISPWARNLGVMANSTAGVQVLSGARFTLGLGVGGIPELTRFTGSAPRDTVQRMREAALLLRRVLSGEEVTSKGMFSTLRGYGLAFSAPAPKIYFGVRGPRMLRLAGEVAEGVIFSGPLGRLGRDVKLMERGAEEAGRSPGEIDRVLWNPFLLAEGEGDLGQAREMVEVMQGSMQSPASLEELCLCGSMEDILGRLPELEALGIREVVVGPPYGPNPQKVVAAFEGGMG